MLNGLTWWWSHGREGQSAAVPLLDPDSALWTKLRGENAGLRRLLSPNELTSPGVVVHIGETASSSVSRTIRKPIAFRRVVISSASPPLPAVVSEDIRGECGESSWAMLRANTISALTLAADTTKWRQNPGLEAAEHRDHARDVNVAAAMGGTCVVRSIPRRSRLAQRRTGFDAFDACRTCSSAAPSKSKRTSGSTQAFGREKGVPTPTIDVVLPLLRAPTNPWRSRAADSLKLKSKALSRGLRVKLLPFEYTHSAAGFAAPKYYKTFRQRSSP